MDGFIFGFLDNAVLIFGAFTGVEIERYIGGQGTRGAVFGAAIGNAVSDGIGAVADPALQAMALGIVLGTLVPIAFLPIAERVRRFFAARKEEREQDAEIERLNKLWDEEDEGPGIGFIDEMVEREPFVYLREVK